eukprot:scaffold256271_cov26-Tisochrysis_lutea.AAC.1
MVRSAPPSPLPTKEILGATRGPIDTNLILCTGRACGGTCIDGRRRVPRTRAPPIDLQKSLGARR